MIKSNAWGEKVTRDRAIASRFSFAIVMKVIALLLGGVLGMLIPFIININYIQGRTIEAFDLALDGPVFWGLVIGAIIMALIILLRQNELAAMLIVAIHLYVDYYLGMYFVAGIMTTVLLLIFFLTQSPQYPWVLPRALWLWMLFVALAIFPAIRGISLLDGFNYYFNVLFCALIMFWLGTTIAYNIARIRHLLRLLSCFGTFVAFVSIIQYATGTLLFSSTRYDADLALSSAYELFSGSGVHRVGAYFVHPNPNGAFTAMMLCVSLGLFVESSSLLGKVFYFIEICILLPALLFTYSNGAWIAMSVGLIAFFVLVGRNYYCILISSVILTAVIFMIVLFPVQLDLLYQHATASRGLPSRIAAWQTGIAVIRAFPLTGLGLGRGVYIQRADPYRVWTQDQPLYHPHNSFIELTALGGFPISIVFILLFLFTLWLALRNWALADVRSRSLIGTGIATAIVLTSYSIGDAGWTLPPLLAISWLILGAISSPYITKILRHGMKEEERS